MESGMEFAQERGHKPLNTDCSVLRTGGRLARIGGLESGVAQRPRKNEADSQGVQRRKIWPQSGVIEYWRQRLSERHPDRSWLHASDDRQRP